MDAASADPGRCRGDGRAAGKVQPDSGFTAPLIVAIRNDAKGYGPLDEVAHVAARLGIANRLAASLEVGDGQARRRSLPVDERAAGIGLPDMSISGLGLPAGRFVGSLPR